jgi:hypothetical protein
MVAMAEVVAVLPLEVADKVVWVEKEYTQEVHL